MPHPRPVWLLKLQHFSCAEHLFGNRMALQITKVLIPSLENFREVDKNIPTAMDELLILRNLDVLG